jgi:predicted nucleic acid-binding protein
LIVLDSSAGIDYLLGKQPEASWVERQLDRAHWRLHAPHLFDVEVVSAVRRLVLSREVPVADGAERARRLAELPLRRYPHVELLDRVWELHPTVTVADACFVALAEALNIPLVTTDRRLGRWVGVRIPVLAP